MTYTPDAPVDVEIVAPEAAAPPLVTVHVYADVVCPWCYIGKRRLETALRQFVTEGGRVSVSYLPFQLDPEASTEATPLMANLAAKFGGADAATQTMSHVSDIALTEGLELDFDAAVSTNTLRAHRLIHVAGQQDSAVQATLAEAIMDAHFTKGLDVGSVDVLSRLAAASGVELDVPAYLDSDQDVAYIQELEGEARAMGVTSVPTFVFGGRWGLSGAQEPETLVTVLRQVADNLAGVQPAAAGGGCCGGGCCG